MTATMCDGSPRLPDGTYIRYPDRQRNGRLQVAKIVGTDMFRSKYEVADRLMGWSEWIWTNGGQWVFLGQFEVITEADALALPEPVEEAP